MKGFILPISATIFTLFCPLTTKAQMGAQSTSIGAVKSHIISIDMGIPVYKATPIESINRLSITTSAGYVPSADISLPTRVVLDRNSRIHDSVRHPREISTTMQNARLNSPKLGQLACDIEGYFTTT